MRLLLLKGHGSAWNSYPCLTVESVRVSAKHCLGKAFSLYLSQEAMKSAGEPLHVAGRPLRQPFHSGTQVRILFTCYMCQIEATYLRMLPIAIGLRLFVDLGALQQNTLC